MVGKKCPLNQTSCRRCFRKHGVKIIQIISKPSNKCLVPGTLLSVSRKFCLVVLWFARYVFNVNLTLFFGCMFSFIERSPNVLLMLAM